MIHPQTAKRIRAEADRWLRYGFLPCEAKIEDWGCQGCSRPVVLLTFADLRWDAEHGYQYLGDLFLDECRDNRAAKQYAAEVNALLNRIYRDWQRKNAGKPAEGVACYV